MEYAYKVCAYGKEAAEELYAYKRCSDPLDIIRARNLAEKIARAVILMDKVIDQTERRVLKNEKVPASEKVVSLFETHTDIILKSRRKTEYGHKVFVVGGVSNLIIDCLIERGNPADSACFKKLLDRQKNYYGRSPRQTSADGGFASIDNVRYAKDNQVKRRCVFKEAGACSQRYGQEQLGISPVEKFSSRYRSQYLNSQACIWSEQVQLEWLGRIQAVCVECDCILQPDGDSQNENGSSEINIHIWAFFKNRWIIMPKYQ